MVGRAVGRRQPLARQMLVMQMGVVLVIVLASGGWVASTTSTSIREDYRSRMLTIARSLAQVPAVLDAYESRDPSATLQPLAEVVRESAGATFVVFTDRDGIRLSHPDAAKIGKPVSTDPSIPLSGEEYVGTQTGSLGESLRAKVPVIGTGGDIIGTVSVGILEDALTSDFWASARRMAAWLIGSVLLGLLGAAMVTRLVHRRIYGLEPDEIAQLLQTRQAMLHSIREGLVAIDNDGRVALVNDEARRLLDLPSESVAGQHVNRALGDKGLGPLLDADDDTDVHDLLVLVGERMLLANRTVARIDGEPVGLMVTFRDRTELFDTLRVLEGQRSVTESLRAQAHEHANQLHVISGLLDLEEIQRAVAYIDRIGGGGTLVPGEMEEMRDPTLAALLAAKAAQARERGIGLAVDEKTAVAEPVGDDVLTLVANLVDNAMDAAGAGGHVRLSLTGGGGVALVIVVDDDGPGVPKHLGQSIFQVGVTTKVHATGAVRGIGLALVHRITTRRGGTVSCVPLTPQGTRFTVTLPPALDPGEAEPTVRGLTV